MSRQPCCGKKSIDVGQYIQVVEEKIKRGIGKNQKGGL